VYCRVSSSQTSGPVAARVVIFPLRSTVEMPTWSKPGSDIWAVSAMVWRVSSTVWDRPIVLLGA